ncbi:MAG: CHAD domain-containing protein [Sulfurimonadaceae bacterium]
MHKIRIRCKQARYSLEFIEASDLKSVAKEIKNCKKILNHFGAIQDAANQLDLLKHFCKTYATYECLTLHKGRKHAFKSLKNRL